MSSLYIVIPAYNESENIEKTIVTALQYFMDIAMPSGRKPIIFSRLIQTVRRTLTNSSHSGTRGAGMMQ